MTTKTTGMFKEWDGDAKARSASAIKAAETRRVNKLVKEIEERLEKLPVAKRTGIAKDLLYAMIGRASAKADEFTASGETPWQNAYYSVGRVLGDLRESYERSVRDAEYRAKASKEGK